jgi:hypothetical protein
MQPVVVDYETFWGPDYTLSSMTTESYIRDPRFKAHGAGIKVGKGKSVWVPEKHLQRVLNRIDWSQSALVGHHLNFDGSILAWHYGIVPARYIDTLALSRCIVGNNASNHKLESAAELLCGLQKYPGFLKESYGVRNLPSSTEERLATYCAGPISACGRYAGDVMLTWEVLRKLLPHMPSMEADAMHWAIKIFTQPQVWFDRDMLLKYYDEVVEQKAEAMRSVDALVSDYMTRVKVKVPKGKDPKKTVLRSNDHYAALLTELGVDPLPMKPGKATKKRAEGVMTYAFAKTDEEHKELEEHPDPRVQAIAAARIEIKTSIEETRSRSYLAVAERNLPWPIHLNLSGAHTHRFSGGKGAGGNPQNLKRGGTLRDAICAPEGKIFLVSDLSQIEARLTLWIGMQMAKANAEFESLEIMRTGGDIYSFFGSHIYGMEITKKTHPYERQVAKSAVLGLGFGMGEKRFIAYARGLDIDNMDLDEAKRIKDIYRSMYTGVKESWAVMQKVIFPALANKERVNYPTDAAPLCYTSTDPVFGNPALAVPGGLHLKYPSLERGEGGGWSYWNGRRKVAVHGGLGLENVCQNIAGWMLRTHITRIQREMPHVSVVTNTHDELLILVDDRQELEEYRSAVAAGEKVKPPVTPESLAVESIMTTVPACLPGLPIAVEYDYGYRYGDAK